MNKFKLFLHNFFSNHVWEKTHPSKFIKNKNPFIDEATQMALGKCKVCGKRELREVHGSSTHYCSDEITRREYYKKYNIRGLQ